MTLQILSLVRLSEQQIELLYQSYPDCNVRCIRPTELGDDIPDVDILLGYDAQMDLERFLPRMPHLQWIHLSIRDLADKFPWHSRHTDGGARTWNDAGLQPLSHRSVGKPERTRMEALECCR